MYFSITQYKVPNLQHYVICLYSSYKPVGIHLLYKVTFICFRSGVCVGLPQQWLKKLSANIIYIWKLSWVLLFLKLCKRRDFRSHLMFQIPEIKMSFLGIKRIKCHLSSRWEVEANGSNAILSLLVFEVIKINTAYKLRNR